MKKNRSQKRSLTFEQLETKATPASLLIALAPLDDVFHERLERAVLELAAAGQAHLESAAVAAAKTEAAPPIPGSDAGNWQFSHSVINLLRFVEDNTSDASREPTVCAAPTWDQCQIADEMLQLKDTELRTLVMASQLTSESTPGASDLYTEGF